MKDARSLPVVLILLSLALVAMSFVGPLRDVAVLFWAAGLVVQLGALAVTMRTSRRSEGHERDTSS